MFGTHYAVEQRCYLLPTQLPVGIKIIEYKCSHCYHIITLPREKHFSYCMYCGKKVKRIGANVRKS